MPPYGRIFISYSKVHQSYALALKNKIEKEVREWGPKLREWEAAGVPDLVSATSIYSFLHTPPTAGSHFPSDVAANLDKAHVAVVFWGEGSGASGWVEAEIQYATTKQKLTIPVLIDEDVPLPVALRYTQALCVFDDPHNWLSNLLEQINEARVAEVFKDNPDLAAFLAGL